MPADQGADRQLTQQILRHRTVLYGFIMAQVADVNETEDIFQEVCLAICEHWSRYDSRYPFRHWALGIARNKVLQYFVQQKKRYQRLDPELSARMVEHPAWDEDEVAEKQFLRECLKSLGERAREIVNLRYGGMSVSRIAERIGWRARSISVALIRAKAALMDCVDMKVRLNRQE